MTAKISSTQIVLDAIRDLHQQEQVVTRETLHAFTDLKLAIIDDRVGVLIEEGLVLRVQRGVFVPAEVHPPARVMSKTVLPDGTVTIDIGDQVLILTPKEDRMLAALQAGVVMQAASIEIGRQAATVSGEMQQRLNRVERGMAKALGDGSEHALRNAIDVTPQPLRDSLSISAGAERRISQTPGAKRARAFRARKKAGESISKT